MRVGSIKGIRLSEFDLARDVCLDNCIYGFDHCCGIFGGLRDERCCLGWVGLVGWARFFMVRVDRIDVGGHVVIGRIQIEVWGWMWMTLWE